MIEVVDYNPEWVAVFEDLADRYRVFLQDVDIVSIEHVGSTSVPGLAAKPIVDIDIIVEPDHLEPAIAAMEVAGFESRGTLDIDDRWAFHEPHGYPVTNTYVVVEGCLALRNHLGVRDLLRSDAELRDEYGALKKAIAENVDDLYDYGEQKSAFLSELLGRAGLTLAERQEIEAVNRAPS